MFVLFFNTSIRNEFKHRKFHGIALQLNWREKFKRNSLQAKICQEYRLTNVCSVLCVAMPEKTVFISLSLFLGDFIFVYSITSFVKCLFFRLCFYLLCEWGAHTHAAKCVVHLSVSNSLAMDYIIQIDWSISFFVRDALRNSSHFFFSAKQYQRTCQANSNRCDLVVVCCRHQLHTHTHHTHTWFVRYIPFWWGKAEAHIHQQCDDAQCSSHHATLSHAIQHFG